MRLKMSSGGCLNWMLISVARFFMRLPARRKKGTPAQRQFSMVEAEGGVGLSAGLGIDAVFVAVADDVLAVDDAGAVLAADGVEDGDGREWPARP